MTVRNIYELMSLLLAGLALYVFLIQLSMPNIRGMRWVSISFLCGAFGAGFASLRGFVPPSVSEVLAGCLAMLVNVFVYWGFTELLRLGRRTNWILWTTFLPCITLVLWFTYAQNHPAPRLFLYTFFTAAQYILLTLLLLRNGTPQTALPRHSLAIIYLCWTAYRIAGLFHLGPRPLALYQQLDLPVTSVLPVAQTFTALLTGFGFVWLAMTCLAGDLDRQSNTDVLTGLLNRRALEKAATREISVSRRKQLPLSLILLDLDRFKAINDFHGHDVGDAVLSLTAMCLRENLRNVDFLARLGGEEFVALLPDTPEPTAVEVAERLRTAISDLRVPDLKPPISFSASFGVTTFCIVDPTWEEMLRRADRALYRAKRNGRNRVELEPTTP